MTGQVDIKEWLKKKEDGEWEKFTKHIPRYMGMLGRKPKQIWPDGLTMNI